MDGLRSDAGPCEAPPRVTVTIEAEIERSSSDLCGTPGFTYTLDADLSGSPVFDDCPESRVTLDPDGCALTVEAQCIGPEYYRRISGVLHGPHAAGRMEVVQRRGFTSTPCNRTELWRIAD